jgi:hypothetical protein
LGIILKGEAISVLTYELPWWLSFKVKKMLEGIKIVKAYGAR